MKKYLFFIFLLLFIPFTTHSKEDVTDWYIKDFATTITVNKDSSLTINETITADCGDCVDKHGIFRVLPTKINTTDLGKIRTPVSLKSITDENGVPYRYDETQSRGTITWKIGDPDVTVTGVHVYKILYTVKNAVRSQDDFDELYWNLYGNYWELSTENFTADITFPAEVTKENSDIMYFTGYAGQKNQDLSLYSRTDRGDLRFQSTRELFPGEGITISVTFPKGIVEPYVPGFIEKYSLDIYGWFILPLISFIVCIVFWKKRWRGPIVDRVIMPEYDPPDNLASIYVGILWKGGKFRSSFVTSAIIQMACKGFLRIEEQEKNIFLFNRKEYTLIKTATPEKRLELTKAEEDIFDMLFTGGDSVNFSEKPSPFMNKLSLLKNSALDYLIQKEYFIKATYNIPLFTLFWIPALIVIFIFISVLADINEFFYISVILFLIIFVVFYANKSRLTVKGAEAKWKTNGFYLYMNTAEKYRARFYEDSNIFERLLPYAVAFGLTDKWVGEMQKFYKETNKSATPVWFHSMSGAAFNISSFSGAMNSVASSISRSVSSSSARSSGGGSSGGGGGGGGGGGW